MVCIKSTEQDLHTGSSSNAVLIQKFRMLIWIKEKKKNIYQSLQWLRGDVQMDETLTLSELTSVNIVKTGHQGSQTIFPQLFFHSYISYNRFQSCTRSAVLIYNLVHECFSLFITIFSLSISVLGKSKTCSSCRAVGGHHLRIRIIKIDFGICVCIYIFFHFF